MDINNFLYKRYENDCNNIIKINRNENIDLIGEIDHITILKDSNITNLKNVSCSCVIFKSPYYNSMEGIVLPSDINYLFVNNGKIISSLPEPSSSLENLYISMCDLSGVLDLSKFINLKNLEINNNKLTKLILPSKIKIVLCDNNVKCETSSTDVIIFHNRTSRDEYLSKN